MAGEARRQGNGAPSVVGALLAAIAIRAMATMATRNESDFKAMGYPRANPLRQLIAQHQGAPPPSTVPRCFQWNSPEAERE